MWPHDKQENRKPLLHSDTCLSCTQLRLQLYQGETDRGLLIAFWARQSLSISFLSPRLLSAVKPPPPSSQGALRCPAESPVSHYDRSDSNVTLYSLHPHFHLHCVLKNLLAAILMLLFHSYAISLSFPVWIPSSPAPTLFLSNSLCPAKHLTFAWPCFCLGVSLCYLRVPCISVGVLSCMSLSCKDRCLCS